MALMTAKNSLYNSTAYKSEIQKDSLPKFFPAMWLRHELPVQRIRTLGFIVVISSVNKARFQWYFLTIVPVVCFGAIKSVAISGGIYSLQDVDTSKLVPGIFTSMRY